MSTNTLTQNKRKVGRPSRIEKLIQRKIQRREIGQHRDLLEVSNKDPNRVYRWVSDNKSGIRLIDKEADGWRYETNPELIISANALGTIENDGTKIRKNSYGEYLYLMSIEKELFDAYQQIKQDEVDDTENAQLGIPQTLESLQGVEDMEFYGSIKKENT